MGDSGYSVRTYVEGDENLLLPIYNQYYGRYAGFVSRTPQHWRWTCTMHPDVEHDGILVACKEEDVVGYAVAGRLSKKEGGFTVYELCYNLAQDQEVIVAKLLEGVNRYTAKNGGNYVTFDAPDDDKTVRRICHRLGFKRNPLNEVLGFIILDIPQFLAHIIEDKKDKLEGESDAFLIRVKDAPPEQSAISIHLTGGKLSVGNAHEKDEHEVVIETNVSTLSRLIFSRASILKTLLESKLSIRPLWKTRKAIRLLSLLSLGDYWYIPRLDQI